MNNEWVKCARTARRLTKYDALCSRLKRGVGLQKEEKDDEDSAIARPEATSNSCASFRCRSHPLSLRNTATAAGTRPARVLEIPNPGGWYDFGFFVGASMFLGGGGAGAGSR